MTRKKPFNVRHYVHSVTYRYHSNRWRWSPSFYVGTEIPIDRPIFLLGTQGAGLTLLSRILQRHEDVVTTTGGSSYWTGSDEMHNLLFGLLPKDYSWHHVPAQGENHNGIFATDNLLPLYARGRDYIDEGAAQQYRKRLQGVLRMHGATPATPKRFLDKSQTNSLRVGLLDATLAGADPHYFLMLRNPFVMIWRATSGYGVLGSLPISEEERLGLAIQHWRNLYEAALAEEKRSRLLVLRYEDFLATPETTVRAVCDFAELTFDPAMMPQKGDRMPLGSAPDARKGFKWYPIRPANNAKHLAKLPDWARDQIAAHCAPLIERFGYGPDA